MIMIADYNLQGTHIIFVISKLKRFGILELRNRVTQNDVTLRETNSKIFGEIRLYKILN